MKTKKNKDKIKPLNEFRFNNARNHPQHVFAETSKKYRSVGITHKSETFGKKNMPLKKNPEKGKNEKAYIRNGIVSDKKKYYSKDTLNNFTFDNEDFKNVKSKERNYKKRRKKIKKSNKNASNP